MPWSRNKPCALGREVGKNLARMTDEAEEQWRAELGFFPVRCASCAFRKGTFPNGCLSTVADAMKCAMEVDPPFHCHHGAKPSGPQSLCAGYLLLAGKRTEVPWPFTQGLECPVSPLGCLQLPPCQRECERDLHAPLPKREERTA